MTVRLELSRAADADLDAIRDYSAEQFGAQQALVYVDALEDAFRQLTGFPRIGARVRGRGELRSFGCRSHRIYYLVEADRLLIVRILHRAMDAGRHLHDDQS